MSAAEEGRGSRSGGAPELLRWPGEAAVATCGAPAGECGGEAVLGGRRKPARAAARLGLAGAQLGLGRPVMWGAGASVSGGDMWRQRGGNGHVRPDEKMSSGAWRGRGLGVSPDFEEGIYI